MRKEIGIYQSFEFECWSGGMTYEDDYLDMMKKYSPNLQPVSKKTYNALMKVFEDDMIENMNATG